MEVVPHDHNDVEAFLVKEMAPGGVFRWLRRFKAVCEAKRGVRRRIKPMMQGIYEAVVYVLQ
jgi:hypothetical protein